MTKHRTAAFFSCVAFLLLTAAIVRGDPPPTFDVWPGAAPGDTSTIGAETSRQQPKGDKPITLVTNVTKPTLTLFAAEKEKATGAAVIICPGGGYSVLAWDLEGTEVADWLNSIGVTAIVLKYRVPTPKGTAPGTLPIKDAQRSISIVRSKAAEWSIDPKRIGILGFSAGGNLTGLACTEFDQRSYETSDDIDKVSCRPDFGVLIYPAWLNEDGKPQLKSQFPISANTPPMFLVHADNDKISAVGSAAMYLALKQAGVSAELHVYAKGGHGFGLRPSKDPCSTWPQQCEKWMHALGLLTKPAA